MVAIVPGADFMSLMNDALRKKNRETAHSAPSAGASDAIRRPWPTRGWAFLLAAVILATGAALAGIYLMQSDTANALPEKPTLSDRTGPAADRVANTASIAQRPAGIGTEPMPAGGGPAMHVTGDMPAAEDHATGHGLPTPASSTTKARPPGARSQSAVTTTAPGDETLASTMRSHASATDAPVKPIRGRSASISRAFEPGPGQPARRDLRPSLPTGYAPAAAPAPPETVGEPDEGHTIRPTAESIQDTDLFYQKARSYHRSGRLTDAIRLYRQVLISSSSHSGAMLNLAAAFMQQGNYPDARALLNRLEHANPRPQGVLLNLAIAAIGTGAPERALTYLDRAAAMSDASPWEIRFHRAVAFARMDRLPEALALYREAEAEQPEAPGLQFNLAVTCDALGLYPEALAHYEAVLQAAAKPSETDRATIAQRVRTIGHYLNSAPSPEKG
jgi:tetratricopeptide (TPR) repeat protein